MASATTSEATRRHSGNRDAGDDANKGLPPFGAQVAGRDEEFEAHERSYQLSAVSSQLDSIITTPLAEATFRHNGSGLRRWLTRANSLV